ncbi:MAG: family 10 glycosylhydrolase, partial [Chloroflexota bacterium]
MIHAPESGMTFIKRGYSLAATVKYRWLLMAILLIPLLVTTLGTTQTSANAQGNYKVYLPLVMKKNVEFRGLWITRFDWTGMWDVGSPARIDEMVNKAADANFNVLLFQVRGTGDAFYTPGLEPWSARLNSSGELGRNPGWDPLAVMIDKAHARGLQVHAYVNTFPTWYDDTAPQKNTVPVHPFWSWTYSGDGWSAWRVWDDEGHMNLESGKYLFASPAAPYVREHIKGVVLDIAQRYQVDGI